MMLSAVLILVATLQQAYGDHFTVLGDVNPRVAALDHLVAQVLHDVLDNQTAAHDPV